MSRASKLTPVEQRRNQIERELEKLKLPKNQKKAKDFKTPEAFENWQERQSRKFNELNEEIIILDNPTEYHEIPLAIAAAELGISLNEMIQIVREELIEISFDGEYREGNRITRDELARAIDVGAEELLRIADQSIEEIFEESIQFLHDANIEAAEKAYERMDKFDYQVNYQYSIAYGIGLELLRGDFDALKSSFWFRDSYDDKRLAATLQSLRRVVVGIKPADHLTAVIREQILAVADGVKEGVFDNAYYNYNSSQFFSQMDENQRHAMMFASVVMAAVDKYNLKTRLSKWNGFSSDPKNEKLEMIIRSAIYTILEAESTYHESPSSKLFVDKYVELFPKRWVPAERIAWVPKNKESV